MFEGKPASSAIGKALRVLGQFYADWVPGGAAAGGRRFDESGPARGCARPGPGNSGPEREPTIPGLPVWLRALGSLHLTVACLSLLIVLTVWGTLYQVHHGIYAAKIFFFTSWFLRLGPLIFPGGKTVMGVFFINLVSAMVLRFRGVRRRFGVWVLHLGLVLLCFAAFCTYVYSRSTVLVLREGEEAGFSVLPRAGEVAVQAAWVQDSKG